LLNSLDIAEHKPVSEQTDPLPSFCSTFCDSSMQYPLAYHNTSVLEQECSEAESVISYGQSAGTSKPDQAIEEKTARKNRKKEIKNN
jgi:hypothetical protein